MALTLRSIPESRPAVSFGRAGVPGISARQETDWLSALGSFFFRPRSRSLYLLQLTTKQQNNKKNKAFSIQKSKLVYRKK